MAKTELNLLDAAFLNIERQEDPWSIHLELQFEGQVDEQRLRAALAHSISQHPLARARLQPFKAGSLRYFWEIDDEAGGQPLSVFDAAGPADVDRLRQQLLSEAVPLGKSPILRLFLVRQADGDRLLLNLNHVLADGLSALRFLNSILRHYSGEPDPLPDVEPLAARDLAALVSTHDVKERLKRLTHFAGYLRKSITQPVRVAARRASDENSDEAGSDGEGEGEGEGAGYGVVTLCLTPDESAHVAARREKPATVNDLLIAALVLTIRHWNESHRGKVGKISVMMPVNLRPKAWWYEVLGNFSSYVNVILAADQQRDLENACRSVCEQTRRFKDAGAAGTLIDVLSVPRFLPAILKARLREITPGIGRSHVQTTWLSNLGRMAEAPSMGDAGRVRAIYFSPPAPRPMGVSLGAVTLEDRMMLTLRYHRALLDAGAAADFAALFRETLLTRTC